MASILTDRLEPQLTVNSDGTINWQEYLIDYDYTQFFVGKQVTSAEWNDLFMRICTHNNYIADTLVVMLNDIIPVQVERLVTNEFTSQYVPKQLNGLPSADEQIDKSSALLYLDANGTATKIPMQDLTKAAIIDVEKGVSAYKGQASNVQDALEEVYDMAQNGGVTGIKGNAEESYRQGNVNITPANIGLGNLTDDRQVKGKASGTTQNHLVKWGADGYNIEDAGVVISTSAPSSSSTDAEILTAKVVFDYGKTKQNALSQAQLDAVNSGIDSTKVGKITTNESAISRIDGIIPNQAYDPGNELADKNFVNSSVNNVAAYYITKNAAGDPFATKAELTNATVFYSGGVIRIPTRNDYCIVQADESKIDSITNETPTTRYLYNNSWEFQYIVNNTPLTAAQIATLNSGITSNLVTQIGTNQTNITNHTGNTNNPHHVTKAQVDLGNVDNTSDADKPVSTAQQTALNGKLDKDTSTTAYDQVYLKQANGTNTTRNVDTSALGNALPQRDSNGQITVPQTPTANNHATSKKYVDDEISTKISVVDISSWGTTITDEQKALLTTNPRPTIKKDLQCFVFAQDIAGLQLTWLCPPNETGSAYEIVLNTSTNSLQRTAIALVTSKTLAPKYSAISTYAVGDIVTTAGSVYRCITAISTPESWNNSHWEYVDVDTLLKGKLDKKTSGATYGLSIPTTTSWTGNKTIATTDQIPTSINGMSGGKLTSPLQISGGDAATASKIALDQTASGQITNNTTQTIFGFTSNNATALTVGHSSYVLALRGSGTRPKFNGNDVALYIDIPTVPATVSVSATGTATNEVQYITIGSTEYKIAGGSGGVTKATIFSTMGLGTLNTENTWGTVTAANGYTNMFGGDQPNGGGFEMGEKDGQTHIQIDGDYWGREGAYKCAYMGYSSQGGSFYAANIYASSDRRLKENIKDANVDSLDIINKIKIKEYNFKADETKQKNVGVIAQELREVLPEELVGFYIQGKETKDDHLSVNDSKLVYLLIDAMQKQQKQIDALKKKLGE